MYYALTVKDNVITGVHESMTPITAITFAKNPAMADDEVRVLDAPVQYQKGQDIRTYEEGIQKPELWCVENGYKKLPPNKEIINGELIDKTLPFEEQPETLMNFIEQRVTDSFGRVVRVTDIQNEIITQLKADNKSLKLRLDKLEGKK